MSNATLPLLSYFNHSDRNIPASAPTPPPRTTSLQIDLTKYLLRHSLPIAPSVSPTFSEYSQLFEKIACDTTTNFSDDHESMFADTVAANAPAATEDTDQCNATNIISISDHYRDNVQHKPVASSTLETIACDINDRLGVNNMQQLPPPPHLPLTPHDDCYSCCCSSCYGSNCFCCHQFCEQNHKQDPENNLDYSNENVNEYDNNYFETIATTQWQQQQQKEHQKQQQQKQKQQIFDQKSTTLIDNTCSFGTKLQIPEDYSIAVEPLPPPPPPPPVFRDQLVVVTNCDENEQQWQLWPPPPPLSSILPIEPFDRATEDEHQKPNERFSVMVSEQDDSTTINSTSDATMIKIAATSGVGDHDKNNCSSQSKTLKITEKLKGELQQQFVCVCVFVCLFRHFSF